jgi:ABC-type nitrate/sulfonate/bicarbonate transport system substrate-binding protein
MIMLKALVLALLTVVASSAVAAGDRPEEVIRALLQGSPAVGAQRT